MAEIYAKKFKDIQRFTLWGDSPVEGKRARLVLAFRDGNPRITVYTGVSGKDGILSFPCDVPNFAGMLALLQDLPNKEPGEKYTIDSKTNVWVDDKPTKEKKNISVLHIGKSQEGIIYIAVIDETHPKIVFPIKPSEFHVFKDKSGNVISDSVMSGKMTYMVCNILLTAVADIMLRHAEEDTYGQTASNGVTKSINLNEKSPDFSVSEDIPY